MRTYEEHAAFVRRAHLAIEAMHVAAIVFAANRIKSGLFDVDPGHLFTSVEYVIANAFDLRLKDPGDKIADPFAALCNATHHIRINSVAEALFSKFADIWEDAQKGRNVTPDSLQELTAAAESRALLVKAHHRSGRWTVYVADDDYGIPRMKSPAIAGAQHKYLAVAAELCLGQLHKALTSAAVCR